MAELIVVALLILLLWAFSGFSSRQQGFETPRGRHFIPLYLL